MDDIVDRVRRTIAEHFNVPVSAVTDPARFVEDLGATSLDIVEMIMVFEDAFEVEISDTEAEKMARVSDVIAFMEEKTGRGAGDLK